MICSYETILKILSAGDSSKCIAQNQKFVVAMQGCSTSGKSTVADCLYKILSQSVPECKPFVFSMDNFYKSDPKPDEKVFSGYSEFSACNESNLPIKSESNLNTEFASNLASKSSNGLQEKPTYDYDNPGALDWDLMFKSLISTIQGDQMISYSTYDFMNGVRSDIEIPNIGYNVIIVEGIFAHSLFSKTTFNTAVLNPMDTFNEKYAQSERILNKFYSTIHKNAHVIPIYLDLDDQSIVLNRIAVDLARVGKDKKLSEEYTKKFVLRSTYKWVRSTAMEKSLLFRRDFNPKQMIKIISLVVTFLGGAKDTHKVSTIISEITTGCLTN